MIKMLISNINWNCKMLQWLMSSNHHHLYHYLQLPALELNLTYFLLDDSLWKKSWYANGITPLSHSDSRSSFFAAAIENCLLYAFVTEHSLAVDDFEDFVLVATRLLAFLIKNAEVGLCEIDLVEYFVRCVLYKSQLAYV